MNNITFGGAGWTFYETLGGGQGASARGAGPSAVHVGMSNTRNTPIESLERAYPIRIDEYAVRRGSGGAGAHRGGDGVVRRYRVLERCTVTLVTERRRRAPRGTAGGGAGAAGLEPAERQADSREVPHGAAARRRRDRHDARWWRLGRWSDLAPSASTRSPAPTLRRRQ